ncbi:MAG TPA: LytTR family DNA-binding domain-containing protein [Candidatus Baltobacteraceae bacterium]
MRTRAIVVDDEPLARRNVTALLSGHRDIAVVGECASGAEALAEIRRLNPDLVFLDVEMPECGGFDVLEMLGVATPPAIVFVTAYDTYALRAFEAGALDYLLKPFDTDRFARAIARALERIAQSRERPRTEDKIAIKSIGGVEFVRVADIDWIEAADYYSRLHAGGRSHLLRRSMAELEADLKDSSFCRIHRSTIVNVERIRSLKLDEDGEHGVLLADGTTLRVSRRYRRTLQTLLSKIGES